MIIGIKKNRKEKSIERVLLLIKERRTYGFFFFFGEILGKQNRDDGCSSRRKPYLSMSCFFFLQQF